MSSLVGAGPWGILAGMKLRLLAAVTAVTLVLTSACGGDKKSDDEAKKGESTTVVQVSPLTGLEFPEEPPANPVFVVKIENSDAGEPQYAVNQADLVVEELVEGGITRLAAFYYSTLPTKVGHVRSLRGTDAGIAAPVAAHVVASGGAEPSYEVIEAQGLTTYTEDNNAPGFSSDSAKKRPYNRLLDLTELAAEAADSPVPGPYFEFLPVGQEITLPGDAHAVTSASVTFSSSHTTEFAFADGGWTRVNGHAAPGEEFVANNLVVVFAPVQDAGYRDSGGSEVPETVFEGTGRAVVAIGGSVFEGTWSKDSKSDVLSIVDAAGESVAIPAGKTWIELVPQDDGAATFE
ncbi:MAG: DUF3048 domain-containing protein [Aeromicrobium sp.]|uniref:DUF3048 domain-containing protein n=1 Tax=Aeromicrobium sp. TaxID=1871063 RepID=UPI0039E2352E